MYALCLQNNMKIGMSQLQKLNFGNSNHSEKKNVKKIVIFVIADKKIERTKKMWRILGVSSLPGTVLN